MDVAITRGTQIVASTRADWSDYTEEQLDPETTIESVPEMVFCASAKQPSAAKILRHLLWANKCRVVEGTIYLYDESRGMFERLERSREWLALCRFFHPRVQQIVGSGTVREALMRLRSTPSIQLSPTALNGETTLINTENGVLDLCSMALVPKKFAHGFTYQLRVNYLGHVSWDDCPVFRSFCETSLQGDEQKIRLLMQVLAYLWSRLWGAKKAFFFVGEPNCGKSVIIELVKRVLGQENTSNIPFHKLGDRFSLSSLADKALNTCAEIKATPLRGLDTFKAVVGGDTMMGEAKGQPAFSFQCRTKLLFAGNTFPQIAETETGEAFLCRLCFLTFPVSIPKEHQDPQLVEKLWAERDAIFSLAVRELPALIANGFAFESASDSLGFFSKLREQHDHLATFIDESCVKGEGNTISTRDLFTAYVDFCNANCFQPILLQHFPDAVEKAAHVERIRARNGGNPIRGFRGITLREPL